MKTNILASAALGAALSVGLASCADLGFGIDLDDGYADPYFYGGGGPVYAPWDWSGFDGPLYGPGWGYSPGPVIGVNPPPRPPRPVVRPPQINPTPTPPSNPGPVFTPGTVNPGGMERPGNMGLPTGEGEVPLNRGRR